MMLRRRTSHECAAECERPAAVAAVGLCAGRGRARCRLRDARHGQGAGAFGFCGHVPARHPALRYGLALNDRGYFWEAQEVLEAVWAAAPQGGRERILLRACIHIANANLRLRMQRSHSAARLFGDALAELRALSSRKAAVGDGFVESFPIAALTASLQAKLGRPQLSKADWIALGTIVRS
ncbi:putative metal-dependent hydrolase [Bradyrhizobium diazoefficiens]